MFTLWLTGLSGAGKSTLARLAHSALAASGRCVQVLDGDEVRKQLSPDLGFSREDRELNVRRLGYLATLLTRHGIIAIVAAISPYESSRRAVRSIQTTPFVEVFVDCDIAELRRRDPKGLYRRADTASLANFTGVSAPYEPPAHPEVHVRTDFQTREQCLDAILEALRVRGLLQ